MNAAIVTRHTSINGKPRVPGDFLSVEEYVGIDSYVRDAMESQGEIRTILDAEAARILENMEAKQVEFDNRLKALEDKFAALES